MHNILSSKDIAKARKLCIAFRRKDGAPVFQTKCRDEFTLVSRVFHVQRLSVLEELRETGKITQMPLSGEFGMKATVLLVDESCKVKTSAALMDFWSGFDFAPKLNFTDVTTSYWDEDFNLFKDKCNLDIVRCLDDVSADVAHLHIDITGDTNRMGRN